MRIRETMAATAVLSLLFSVQTLAQEPAPSPEPASDQAPAAAEVADGGWRSSCDGSGTCGECTLCGESATCGECTQCGEDSCCEECSTPPLKLLDSDWMRCNRISVGGWIAQGFTTNRDNPVNPPWGLGNLPTTFNYRSDDYQLNQLYTYIERQTDTSCGGFDIGGRIDLLYGEDYIFTQAAGLETRPDFTNHWNTAVGGGGIGGTGRLGLALPQAYMELAVNDLSVKVGHFYTIIGNEVVTAPDNFFYSHTYTMQYGEPFTHTGALASHPLGERVEVKAGVVNGWDKFDATHDHASFLGGFTWTSCDEQTSLAFAMVSGQEDGAQQFIGGNRTMYSLVFTRQLTGDLQYVLHHDFGWQERGRVAATIEDAEWYGLTNNLFYTVNDKLRAGFRYEWFNDDDGTRVVGFGTHWHNITLGLNYQPIANLTLRPEARWDWATPHEAGTPAGPYDNVTRRDQFTLAMDAILTY